jgi:hypothetical protein
MKNNTSVRRRSHGAGRLTLQDAVPPWRRCTLLSALIPSRHRCFALSTALRIAALLAQSFLRARTLLPWPRVAFPRC